MWRVLAVVMCDGFYIFMFRGGGQGQAIPMVLTGCNTFYFAEHLRSFTALPAPSLRLNGHLACAIDVFLRKNPILLSALEGICQILGRVLDLLTASVIHISVHVINPDLASSHNDMFTRLEQEPVVRLLPLPLNLFAIKLLKIHTKRLPTHGAGDHRNNIQKV